jgi:four helix bundle protein
MAHGSLAEAETQLLLAQRLGYLSEVNARALLAISGEISRMLVALSGSLVRRRAA